MSLFLSEVAQRHADEFIVMVMDQAGWHIAGDLAVPQNMCVVLLPAYSPELNPAEHLWEALRDDCFANHVFANLDAVETALTHGLVALETNPSRTRSMTGFGWITSISLNASLYQGASAKFKAIIRFRLWASACHSNTARAFIRPHTLVR